MLIVASLVIGKSNPMPVYRWMNKQVEVYPYNRLLLSNKREWTADAFNMDESQNNVWKKPDKHENILLYMTPFVETSRKCKLIYGDRKQRRTRIR